MNIYQKINAIMKQVPYVKKEDKKVNGQYTFVSHDAVSAALQPHMAEIGIVMVPSVEELTREGNMTIVKMKVIFINSEKPEEKIESYHYGYGIDPQDKGVGKAVSYAVKYALLKTFCLETGDDPERDTIDAKDELNVSLDLVSKKRKYLEKLVATEDLPELNKYIALCAKTWRCTENESYIRINDPKDFIEAFQTWKAKALLAKAA